MKKAKKNIILNNKDKSYDELFKLIQDDEEAKVKALLETRGVRDKLKLLSENNKTGLYDVKLLNFIVENGKKGEITIPDMISASANTSIDTKTLDILGELGCEFINSKRFRDYFTWGRINDDNEVVLDKYIEDILSMPSNENSRLEVFKKILGSATMIPVTGRTSSYIDDEGNKVYKYNGSLCGNSFAICQAAGMFLLTRQIDPNIRYDGFVEIVKNQERLNSDGMMYVDTEEIINKVIERSKTKDTQDLGLETIFEQQNTHGKDATEQALDKQIMIRTTNDNVQSL